MIKQLRAFFKGSQVKKRSDLDVLLDSLTQLHHLQEKLEWLERLLAWIRYEGMQDSHLERETGKIPTARIRFLLMVLDRHPAWKKELARLLRKIVRHISAMELFTETGISSEDGFFGEVSGRLVQKLLPQQALDMDLASLFIALFPDEKDHLWIESIDAVTFKRIVELFHYEVSEEEGSWNHLIREMEDALSYLVIHSRAIGLSPKILRRLDHAHFRESPFYDLVGTLEGFFKGLHSRDRFQYEEGVSEFRKTVHRCQTEVSGVHKHLEEHGVSVNMVYQLARLEAYLKRIESITSCLTLGLPEHHFVLLFLSQLVQDNQEIRSIRTLIGQNISLLARKVVERSAETGEHYITRTREEYRHMLQAALGGGMFTAMTVYLKVFIVSLGTTGFVQGIFASLNYAFSFVAIHLAGFTLGTKQPAMTGPALANKMRTATTEKGMTELVDEIVHLIRSQMASIFGNVFAVIPTVLVMDAIIHALIGRHIIGKATAEYAMHSVDILGPTAIYAAFTGVLLWLSSLTAGWADNWFALRGLRKSLTHNPRMISAFGKVGARSVARFFERNMSALVGNISLGVMLGLVPEIMKFLSIPLDVRHVTLSSGSLAAAIPVLGWEVVLDPSFIRIVLGIFFIGLLNVSVSFALALWVAWRATEAPWMQKKIIYRAVMKRFLSRPLSFFFPVGKTVREAESRPKQPH